jgi:hypothetical protein
MALVGMASKPLHVRRLQKALQEWVQNPGSFLALKIGRSDALEAFEALKLSSFQAFKLSSFQAFKLQAFKHSIFQAFNLSGFQAF